MQIHIFSVVSFIPYGSTESTERPRVRLDERAFIRFIPYGSTESTESCFPKTWVCWKRSFIPYGSTESTERLATAAAGGAVPWFHPIRLDREH